MLREMLVLATALTVATPAAADPPNMCGMEEQGAQSPPCPPYVTYDEDGEVLGGAAQAF